MKKIFKKTAVILVMVFLNFMCVKALPATLGPINQVGNRVLDSCGSSSCYGLALKVSGSTAVICTEYNKPTPAAVSATCTINNDWDEKVRYGVAAIISKASSNISASAISNQYFAAELAINEFLSNKNAGGASIAATSLSNTYRTLYSDYLDTANAAYNNYVTDSNLSITLSATSLTFTLNGNNYESNSVTVSGVSNYSVTSNIGNISKSGQTFKVVVPASSVNSTKSIEVTVSASKTLNQARNYNCGDNYQTITPVSLDTISKSASKSLKGSITPKGKLTINKLDQDNKHLSGAVIRVTGPNNYSNTFTTVGEPIVLEELEYGTYTIVETQIPVGYIGSLEKKVVLSSEKLNETITLINEKNKVIISKIDVVGQKELPGATLEIQDEQGNIVKHCVDEKGNTNAECKWVSTDKPYEILGLPIGKYYLVETISPKGYELNKEKVLFEVKDGVKVTEVVMKNQLEVEVPNTLSARSALLLTIAMFDIALGIGIITYVKKNKVKE